MDSNANNLTNTAPTKSVVSEKNSLFSKHWMVTGNHALHSHSAAGMSIFACFNKATVSECFRCLLLQCEMKMTCCECEWMMVTGTLLFVYRFRSPLLQPRSESSEFEFKPRNAWTLGITNLRSGISTSTSTSASSRSGFIWCLCCLTRHWHSHRHHARHHGHHGHCGHHGGQHWHHHTWHHTSHSHARHHHVGQHARHWHHAWHHRSRLLSISLLLWLLRKDLYLRFLCALVCEAAILPGAHQQKTDNMFSENWSTTSINF